MRYPNGYSVEVTKAWHRMENQGMSWKDMERQDMAWQVKSSQGKAH
jgi:hypothetical protein